MTIHVAAPTTHETKYWLGEVLAWAEANGESYDAVQELKKIPARMNQIDDDIGLIPAGLAHFDKVIAPSPYGVVSKSKDIDKARRRANSRVRALLVRFHQANGLVAPQIGHGEWDRVIALVKKNEGFTARGALFSTGKHKSFFPLRARCQTSPLELTQEEIGRIAGDATPKVRKSIKKGIRLINELITLQNVLPEVRELLPPVGFTIPGSPDRARRILWSWLPEALRANIESVFQQTLAKPEDRAANVKARLEAGEDPETVLAEVNAFAKVRRRKIDNPRAALSGYQTAVTWLWRSADDRDRSGAAMTLAELMTRENLETACEDQIQRSKSSLTLKDPKLSQTLNGRLTNLRTVAGHGMRRPDMVALIDLMKISYWEYIVTPKQMTEDAEHTCKVLRDNPQIAAKFVRGPYMVSDQALADIERAKANSDEEAEDRALRLYAAAAMQAIQLSRPMRTSNIIRVRHRGCPGSPGNIVWIRDKKKAEITFLPGEIKNDIKVLVTVLDNDAEILWKWQNGLRARFVELRQIPDSPYLFPGERKGIASNGLRLAFNDGRDVGPWRRTSWARPEPTSMPPRGRHVGPRPGAGQFRQGGFHPW